MSGNTHHINWTSFPIQEESIYKSLILVCGIIAFCVGIVFIISIAYALFAFAVLFMALSKYFLPTRYKLDDQGFSKEFLFFSKHRLWKDYKRTVGFNDGIFISPMAKTSRLDNFRGEFIKLEKNMNGHIYNRVIKSFIG